MPKTTVCRSSTCFVVFHSSQRRMIQFYRCMWSVVVHNTTVIPSSFSGRRHGQVVTESASSTGGGGGGGGVTVPSTAVTPVTSNLVLLRLSCQASSVTESVLWLVCTVSVYCDRVKWQVWHSTSTSVWQHVKWSEQIRSWDPLCL